MSLAGPQAHALSWSAAKLARIDRIVGFFRANAAGATAAPSLSLSIGIDGALVAAKGYGASDGLPVTGRTLYEIGSVTKQFTAAVTLELIDKGAVLTRSGAKLTLATPLAAVFGGTPYWKDQPWLTVGRLLTMQSNLPNFTRHPPAGTDPWRPIRADELFRDIEAEPPSTVSNDFDYSNTNYFLLAEVIERCRLPGASAPDSYHDLVRKWIFQPAGMIESRFIDDSRSHFGVAAPLQPTKTAAAADSGPPAIWAEPEYGHRLRPPFIHPDWLKGSADAVSSAVDLFAWDKALMNGKIVPENVRDAMLTGRARVSPLMYYGMGWFYEQRDGRDVYSHSGAVPGYTSYNEIVRQKDGHWYSVSILSNGDQLDGMDDLAANIAYVVTQ